jgi:MoaA/NifB/PqqE/SkfB family radical SAM enzyme
VLSSRYSPWDIPAFAVKYAWLTMRRRPVLVHFEVTMRCNARCGFCDYWKTDASTRDTEAKSFADAARYFNPMLLCFTGGEPLMRQDLEELVAAVNAAVRTKYITLLTHGAMLTPDRAKSLWDAGVNQLSISLDYLDERHDKARGIPRLSSRILDAVPRMREMGIDNIRFNTVIKKDNLDHVMAIVARAVELGIGVNLSVYTDAKNGNTDHLIEPSQFAAVDALVAELLAFKRKNRRVITNSDYYLEQIPRYLRNQMGEPCRSGIRTIHIDPLGNVKRCPDFPTDFHWRDFERYEPVDCNQCFYACRGEAQAPLRLSRIRDIMA